MKIQEFINQEFKEIVVNELNQTIDLQQRESLITKSDTFDLGEDFDNLDDIIELFEKEEVLSKLKFSGFILEQIFKIDDLEYSLNDLDSINKQILNRPTNKLLPLLWVYQQINVFKEEEFFEKEVAEFLELLFEKYNYLVEFEDFFKETGIRYEILWQERLRNSNEILFPIFQKAVQRYPGNIYLKKILGFIRYFNGAYSESVDILNFVLKTIKENDLSIDELVYLEILEYQAMNYDKLGDEDKVSEYVEYILSNLPKASFDDGDIEIVDWTIDTFFLRMRLNMKKEDKQKVLEDYERVKEGVIEKVLEEYGNKYPDVIEYVMKYEKNVKIKI